MKAKSFQNYLEKRLDKNEIAEIEKLAKLEMEFLQSLQVGAVKIIDMEFTHD